MIFSIQKELCTKCDACRKSCPSGLAISITNQEYSIQPDFCIECGHCAAVCPSDAISCDSQKLETIKPTHVDSEDLYALMKQKRSVRHYKRESISKEIINKIIEICESSATASNKRDLKISILQGEEVAGCSKILAKAMLKKIKFVTNPIVKTLFSKLIPKSFKSKDYMQNFTKEMELTQKGEKDRFFFKAPCVIVMSYPKHEKMFGRTNCAIAASQSMLFADNLGIGSCFVGFAEIFNKQKAARNALKLQNNYVTGIVFSLGYKNENFIRIPKREKYVKNERSATS